MIQDLLEEEEHDHDEEYDRHSVPGRPDPRTAGAALSEQGWYAWHAPYDDLESEQTDRLGAVQEQLVAVLDEAPDGRVRALSVCSGQSRDLLPILISHPRGHDVTATMLELDPLNASFLHGALGSTDLVDVRVVVADAGESDAYLGAVPADLVLLCGVFANVVLADAARTVDLLPALCAPGARVVWSSYGTGLADVDAVLDLLEAGLFEAVEVVREDAYVVATHRYTGATAPLPAGQRVFEFRG